ncbi:interferon-induced protein 44-like [Denticeps clupeoides]|uniref:TLDc domain-containing protein n=1 Tax=Denticeps clupeoides TaxID=299321 RepID=A0AAY4A445_9TELE|nr:interferon-induced protein 44-like [Denticeps clupeoides]
MTITSLSLSPLLLSVRRSRSTMSDVRSRLTKKQEGALCSLLFGSARLSLLFKASVHSYKYSAFHQKCDRQGPTLTVAYNKVGFIFGGFISKDFAQTGSNLKDDKAFLYGLDSRGDNLQPQRIHVIDGQCSFCDVSSGPNFGGLVFLDNGTQVYSNPGTFYNFDPALIHGNDLNLIELEVYRVEDFDDYLEMPWRNIDWSLGKRKELMGQIESWKPIITSVTKAQVLLVGPVGAGKSSFFNSLNSIFQGHVTSQAIAGSASFSLTTQFRSYSIKFDSGTKTLPIILCDTMGLESDLNEGVDVADLTSILKGRIQDRYKFNPAIPLEEDATGFRKFVQFKDKIHCVLYVFDSCKVKCLSEKLLDKFAAFRRKACLMGVPQLVLLTNVDNACTLVAADLKNVYHSRYIERMIQEAAARLGVSASTVIPVRNYSRELELNSDVDVLLLSAVIQILRAVNSYFDDIKQEAEPEN